MRFSEERCFRKTRPGWHRSAAADPCRLSSWFSSEMASAAPAPPVHKPSSGGGMGLQPRARETLPAIRTSRLRVASVSPRQARAAARAIFIRNGDCHFLGPDVHRDPRVFLAVPFVFIRDGKCLTHMPPAADRQGPAIIGRETSKELTESRSSGSPGLKTGLAGLTDETGRGTPLRPRGLADQSWAGQARGLIEHGGNESCRRARVPRICPSRFALVAP